MNKRLRCVCEGAVFTAAAIALSYVEIQIGFLGGSINPVMIPLIIYAVRWGAGWGLGAGLICGTLKFFFAGGVAVNWQSMLLDYSVAYMFVGFAGLMKNRKWGLVTGGAIGCAARFFVHFLSGITIYAIAGPEKVLGITTSSPYVFSLLYNGAYMLPSTVLALIIGAVLTKPLNKYVQALDIQ